MLYGVLSFVSICRIFVQTFSRSKEILFERDGFAHFDTSSDKETSLNTVELLINWIAKKLKVPANAVAMFKAANQMSGIDRKTLPTELIPLNTIQLARGLLNFSMMQSNMNWIFPFWAEQQYTPESTSFVPRAHLGSSMNITHRNWTAVGSPQCETEPIIDPRGFATLFRNEWSIDVWLMVNGEILFPSKSESAKQQLQNNLPIVLTEFSFHSIKLTLTSFVHDQTYFHHAELFNETLQPVECTVAFAIRPFNPEGVSLIHDLKFNEQQQSILINDMHTVLFDRKPTRYYFSNYGKGDSASHRFSNSNQENNPSSIHCDIGLANGALYFNATVQSLEKYSVSAQCVLTSRNSVEKYSTALSDTELYWKNLLVKHTTIQTPDEKLNALLTNSLTTLLLLCDKESITPGPTTYHYFWFRDAAYMVLALDLFGYAELTQPIVKNYFTHLKQDGYFRSQQGEWDSNGQVIFSVYQHCVHTNDFALVEKYFSELYRGIQWVASQRLTEKKYSGMSYYGLLPAGLSAEHLGLSDFYFWDNFWSLAAIEMFIDLCTILDKPQEKEFVQKLFNEYSKSITEAIATVQKKYSVTAIPATPTRNIDCGMIGSVCGIYPLQIFPANHESSLQTLQELEKRYFVRGMFFQHFIHSGMNPYLSLQIAHSYLLLGNKDKFWELTNAVFSFVSPTLNYPEAIHPTTLGGCMGDGHHGWVAAEIAIALRDVFILELKNELRLLSGIPRAWYENEQPFSIRHASSYAGEFTITASKNNLSISITIHCSKKFQKYKQWKLYIPFIIENSESISYHKIEIYDNETIITLPAESITLIAHIRQ